MAGSAALHVHVCSYLLFTCIWDETGRGGAETWEISKRDCSHKSRQVKTLRVFVFFYSPSTLDAFILISNLITVSRAAGPSSPSSPSGGRRLPISVLQQRLIRGRGRAGAGIKLHRAQPLQQKKPTKKSLSTQVKRLSWSQIEFKRSCSNGASVLALHLTTVVSVTHLEAAFAR